MARPDRGYGRDDRVLTAVATFSELVITGMAPGEVLATRAMMVPIMIATGRPYTVWRDWLMARAARRTRLGRIGADVLAFLAFQVPVYGGTLLLAGASAGEAMRAIASATVFMILLARPFGLFVERARIWAGLAVRGEPPCLRQAGRSDVVT